MSDWVKIHAPATISNIGPGFDIFGMALQQPGDTIYGRKIDSGMVISDIQGPGAAGIPKDPALNSVSIAAAEVLRRTGDKFGIEIRIEKGIRPCSGIGSSGASAAGGAYLAHVLTGKKLTPNEVVLSAAHAEEVTSGGFHADNVAPCILGGFTIIRSYNPFEVVNIQPPKDLGVVVGMPDVMVATKDSRKVLPPMVSVKDLVFHVGHASCMVHGMETGDIDLIARSAQDAVFEPARTKLVPHLKEAEAAAVKAGAVCSFLGGSGPCVISFYKRSEGNGDAIAAAVKKVYADGKMKCDTWVTTWGSGCKEI
jgi:homoserine kinase